VTGFLKRRRLYLQSATDPGAMSSNDVVQVFNVDGNGNLGNEQYFGGDQSPFAPTSSDLCAQALPGSPEYQIDRGYVYGVNSAMRYDVAGFMSLNLGIDPSTGLPTYSRDTQGIQTNFTYDALGRLAYVLPRDGVWTQYLYHAAASPSSLASLTVDRQQNGSPSISLAQTRYFYDALGRLIKQDVRMPDGTRSARTTSYNALGWKTAVSEQGGPNTNLTQYLNYDPLGRPGIIRPPDSTPANSFSHDVKLDYSGVQMVRRTVHVANGPSASSAETPFVTTQTYDRFGRLASVTEPSGNSGGAVITSYQYDPGNRLTQVSTSSAGTTQTRLFTYDRRGFLSWETHPETAPNTIGLGHHKDYFGYDSRGHFHRKQFKQMSAGVVGPQFRELTNNCAQFACSEIIKASDPNTLRKVFIETIEVTTTGPVLTTDQALLLLYGVGLLDPGLGRPNNVQQQIIYWSYYPSQ
jgi:YD repeat-containing protein